MSQVNEYALGLVKELVPNFDKVEFKASIGDTSRSVEFFVWVNGEKFQCYELADAGKIDESQMETFFESFANIVRSSGDYLAGKVNKISFSG